MEACFPQAQSHGEKSNEDHITVPHRHRSHLHLADPSNHAVVSLEANDLVPGLFQQPAFVAIDLVFATRQLIEVVAQKNLHESIARNAEPRRGLSRRQWGGESEVYTLVARGDFARAELTETEPTA